jgi:hypothetical protein
MMTVKVACRQIGGIRIRLFKRGDDDGTGAHPTVAASIGVALAGPSALHAGAGDASPLGLEPGVTEVDGDFWREWKSQNEGHNPLYDRGLIYEVT